MWAALPNVNNPAATFVLICHQKERVCPIFRPGAMWEGCQTTFLIFVMMKCIGQPPVHMGRWPLLFLEQYIDARANCVGFLLDECMNSCRIILKQLAAIRYLAWLNDNYFFSVWPWVLSIRPGSGIDFQYIAANSFVDCFLWALGVYPFLRFEILCKPRYVDVWRLHGDPIRFKRI